MKSQSACIFFLNKLRAKLFPLPFPHYNDTFVVEEMVWKMASSLEENKVTTLQEEKEENTERERRRED